MFADHDDGDDKYDQSSEVLREAIPANLCYFVS
jgi:hypothetical protein